MLSYRIVFWARAISPAVGGGGPAGFFRGAAGGGIGAAMTDSRFGDLPAEDVLAVFFAGIGNTTKELFGVSVDCFVGRQRRSADSFPVGTRSRASVEQW